MCQLFCQNSLFELVGDNYDIVCVMLGKGCMKVIDVMFFSELK